jgi:hypothetical protein
MNIFLLSLRPVEEVNLEVWLAKARQLIGSEDGPPYNRVQNLSPPQSTRVQNPSPPQYRIPNPLRPPYTRVQNPSPPPYTRDQNPSPPYANRVQKKPSPYLFHTVHVNNRTVTAITIR